LEIIFVLLQVTLIKCLTKFVCNGFIESINHSLHIFNNHRQNNKNRNNQQKHFGLGYIFLFWFTTPEEVQARVASVKPSSLIVASAFR